MLERVWRKGNPLTLLVGMQTSTATRRTVWRFLKKLGIELPYDPAIPLLGIHTEETRIKRDTCTPMFISALFIIAKTWKQPSWELKKIKISHSDFSSLTPNFSWILGSGVDFLCIKLAKLESPFLEFPSILFLILVSHRRFLLLLLLWEKESRKEKDGHFFFLYKR